MATFKHISSKNADYGAAEQYLTFEHDEFTMKPTLDKNGQIIHQGRIHHFPSLFLGLPCFPCSKSWRMKRFNLSSTLWVLVAEKYTSTKYLVLSIFCCKQGVNRPVVLV